MRCPSTPSSLAAARRAPSLDGAAIISATASACVRSILPLRKARRVNSPRSASRAPQARHASSTEASRTGPPWHWNSATSSPVKVLGPGMCTASASSSTLPSVSRTRPRRRVHGLNPFPFPAGRNSFSRMGSASGPLTRTMPTPPAPGAVAIAAIVSVVIEAPDGERMRGREGETFFRVFPFPSPALSSFSSDF